MVRITLDMRISFGEEIFPLRCELARSSLIQLKCFQYDALPYTSALTCWVCSSSWLTVFSILFWVSIPGSPIISEAELSPISLLCGGVWPTGFPIIRLQDASAAYDTTKSNRTELEQQSIRDIPKRQALMHASKIFRNNLYKTEMQKHSRHICLHFRPKKVHLKEIR